MVELKEVYKYYNSNGVVTVALQNINLKFAKGEIVAITGESGGGKSTLLNIITGMDNYDEGEIYYKGNETSYFNGDDMDDFRKKHVGFIFQNYNIIDSYTVLQNVMFPLLVKGVKKEEAKKEALKLIERVGLLDRAHNRGTKLSGGEKQRVVIARALASDCDILACDEPTGNLDSKTGKEIIELIKEVAADKLVLIVTHNYEEVKDIATRKVVISDGKVTEDKVLKPVLMDENYPLDLDYKPIEKKTIGLLTRFNILATPKKTTLLAMIFFVIALVVYTLYQSVTVSIKESNYTYNYYSYNVRDDNFLVVNNKDKTKLDLTAFADLSTNVKVNPFNEYVDFTLSLVDENYIFVRYVDFPVAYYDLKGEQPTDASEALLILPTNYYYGEEFYKKNVLLSNSIRNNKVLEVTALAYSDYISTPVIKTGADISTFLNERLSEEIVTIKTKTNDNIRLREGTTSTNTVYLPKGYSISELDISFMLNDVYELDVPYEVKYGYYASDEVIVELCANFLETIDPYEVRIYDTDADKLVKEFRNNDFNVIYPATKAEIDAIARVSLVINAIVLLVPVFLIYIVTFLVLGKVYLSKVKEYTIMRTLGIARLDMRKMVILETMIIGGTMMLLAFIFLTLTGLIPLKVFAIFKEINLFYTLFYFGVMLLFSYFVGRKFATKLFSKTSNKMLKEEAL